MKSNDAPEADSALRVAADAGRLVLESGGETYRAEEAMLAFLTAFGVWNGESFATPTGFMLSCDGEDGSSRALVRRVRTRQMNLERISAIDSLARRATAGELGFDAVESELCALEARNSYPAWLAIPGAALGAGFFSLLFGGSWKDALVAGAVGVALGRMTQRIQRARVSDFFTNIAGGAITAFLCMAAVHWGLADAADKAIIGAIMLLVPGVTITNGIRDIIAGDLVAGIARMTDAFMSAAGISIGSGVGLETWMLVTGVLT